MVFHYAIFSAHFAPHVGGVESFTEKLAIELIKQGNAATVVTSRLDESPELELREDGVTIIRLPAHSLMGGRLPISNKNGHYKMLTRELEGMSVDRVLVNTRFYKHSLEGLRFASRLNVPAVVLDHGSAHLALGNKIADKIIEEYEHNITDKVKKYTPIFAGISQQSTLWLKHFGIETDIVIPNGIDVDDFRNCISSRDVRAEIGVPDDEFLIVYIGRITPEKGAEKLLDSVNLLGRKDVHVVLAGSGFMQKQLEARNQEYVHFIGSISRNDISALLKQADLFCLPSRSEGFCSALLEASAWGVPSVITDVGIARDVIRGREYGRIISSANPKEIADSISELISMHSSERNRMGNMAKRATEEYFSWQNTVTALNNAFLQTLN